MSAPYRDFGFSRHIAELKSQINLLAFEEDKRASANDSLPVHVISLDESRHTRWLTLVKTFRASIHSTYLQMQALMLSKISLTLLQMMFNYVEKLGESGHILFYDELKSIAKAVDIPTGGLCILQIVYEISACCTSMIVNSPIGPVHYRTLDWAMPGLKPLLVHLEFRRENKVVFHAISWAGFVGVLTAMKPGVASVSLNYRKSGCSVLGNLWRLWKGRIPIGYLIRYEMERAISYDDCIKGLSTPPLIAPCYLTIAGCQANQACTIVRDADRVVAIRRLSDSCLIQTNIDTLDAEDTANSKARHVKAKTLAGSIVPNDKLELGLLKGFMVEPIDNKTTVFGCVMNARTGQVLSVKS